MSLGDRTVERSVKTRSEFRQVTRITVVVVVAGALTVSVLSVMVVVLTDTL